MTDFFLENTENLPVLPFCPFGPSGPVCPIAPEEPSGTYYMTRLHTMTHTFMK